MQVLIRYKGNVLGQIRESQSVTLGRDLGNGIVLESPQVSRRHAKITLKDGIIHIEDLGSTHGTWQGSNKVKTARFGTESEIGFGGAILQFDFSQYRVGTKTERMEDATYQTLSGSKRLEKGNLSATLNLALKTWPYMVTRFGILFAYSIAYILWIAIWGKGLTMFGSKAHPIVWLFVLFSPMGVFQFFLKYSLYVLKAGHIACLTKIARGEEIPEGNMVTYGKNIVTKHFVQVNVLFAVDVLVRGITRQFNSTLDWVTSLLPIPGLQGIISLVKQVISMATTYIDEAILSYNLSRKHDDVWLSSRNALILYAQNSKQMLMAAVWAVIFEYALTAVLIVICLAPAVFLMKFAQPGMGLASLIVGILFAANIKAAFVHPVLLTFMLLKYHNVIEGQQPDRVWQQNLEKVSSKFKELGSKIGSGTKEPSRSAV